MGNDTIVCQLQERLVVIDHHSPVTELLSPQPGVGRFSCTAFGSEEIGGVVYGYY